LHRHPQAEKKAKEKKKRSPKKKRADGGARKLSGVQGQKKKKHRSQMSPHPPQGWCRGPDVEKKEREKSEKSKGKGSYREKRAKTTSRVQDLDAKKNNGGEGGKDKKKGPIERANRRTYDQQLGTGPPGEQRARREKKGEHP